MDFLKFQDYKDHFDVMRGWIAGATVGAAVPSIGFVIAVAIWVHCRPLWTENLSIEAALRMTVCATTEWLTARSPRWMMKSKKTNAVRQNVVAV